MTRWMFFLGMLISVSAVAQTVVVPPHAVARVQYGAERVRKVLKPGWRVVVRVGDGASREGFVIEVKGKVIYVRGDDASGALYGCLELAERIRSGALASVGGRPGAALSIRDRPEMPLRGACIGMQKPVLLPGRGPYEYPYTPQNFPWFYDKKLWTRYLDSMVDNRMNTLYLWNGHPFASLVRLAEYPFAVEVDDKTLARNEEMYSWLATEADRRGIWLIQLFYNIIVSKPFAEHYHIRTQDRSRHIEPVIADYTRKSIAAFVAKYPNVGLMVTLGEAMEGVGQDDIDWFTKTILPGIKDGLRVLGRKDEPPVVLRAHDTDGPAVMKAALPVYGNLYVECKYNGEALTTYTPRGPWAELHRKLSSVSKGLIENVHIMANLEPFRWGSPDFIQKCVQAMHNDYHASGLHLYPQASYWDWPYAADRLSAGAAGEGADGREGIGGAATGGGAVATPGGPRLLEMDRDWIWYMAWARYAWNCHRERKEEVGYWSRELACRYGCDEAHGKYILDAYEQAGEIAPKLLRRFGITDGNRQTLTLGMLMTQLIDPERYGLFSLLYNSEGPPGESLSQYAEREWKGLSHEGETPLRVCADVRVAGVEAVDAISKASGSVTRRQAEFGRLVNDMRCYKALADCYADKVTAALYVLRYKYSGDVDDLVEARHPLEESYQAFGELTRLADSGYLYANSMQTAQRKIPMRGVDGTYKTWGEMKPVYAKELENFAGHLDSLARGGVRVEAPAAYRVVTVDIGGAAGGSGGAGREDDAAGRYEDTAGARPFADSGMVIRKAAGVLAGVKGVVQSARVQLSEGTELTFACKEPVDLLIGFFDERRSMFLQASQLETDASANDFGQADVRIADGVVVEGMPPVQVHAWSYSAGTHTLKLGKGLCLVLGFVKPLEKGKVYDAGLSGPGKKNLDWLFE